MPALLLELVLLLGGDNSDMPADVCAQMLGQVRVIFTHLAAHGACMLIGLLPCPLEVCTVAEASSCMVASAQV